MIALQQSVHHLSGHSREPDMAGRAADRVNIGLAERTGWGEIFLIFNQY